MTKDAAINYFGTQAALARALGIGRASVHEWREIPIGRQYQIEVLTSGALMADRDTDHAASDQRRKSAA